MNKVGRKIKINEKITTFLKQAYIIGATDQEACAYAGISPSALYRYQARNPEFRQKKEAWKINPYLQAKSTIVKRIMEGDVKLSMWYLEKYYSDEFGKPRIVTVYRDRF